MTKGFNHRRVPQRVWVCLALLAALAAASCGEKDKQAEKFDIERPPDFDRALNQTELDSLRAMKITHRVVRDEYWDQQGGVIANDRTEVWYPNRKIYVLQAIAVLKQMDGVANEVLQTFGALPSQRLVVLCAPNLDTFRAATGKDWWHYGAIKGDTLSMQTPMTLYMRNLLQVAARREYTRWAVGRLTSHKAPLWVVWGMSSYLGTEHDVLRAQRGEYAKVSLRMKADEIEENLQSESERLETRRAMYNAYLMVEHLVQTHGMPAVAAFVLALGEEPDANAASQRVFQKSYDEVLAEAQAWTEPVIEQPAP